MLRGPPSGRQVSVPGGRLGPYVQLMHLLRPQARDPLHQQRRGTAGVLHRPHRPATERSADAEQRVKPRSDGFRQSELPGYTMDRSMRIRINDFLARNESPVIT